jgi:hypothetical protein
VFLSFAAYTACYAALLARYRLPGWTSAGEFLQGRGQPWFRLLTFCQVCALVTPLSFAAFVAALAVSVAPRFAAVAQFSMAMAVAFATLSSVYYVVQLRLALWADADDRSEGLEHLFQLNPAAVFTVVNILAWTLFFAASCACLAPLFLVGGGTAAWVLGVLLLLNAGVCLLGLVGYLGRVRALNVLFFNGMGLAVLAFSLLGAALL